LNSWQTFSFLQTREVISSGSFLSLSAVYGGEAFINPMCATGATDLQSSIKEQ
jgi:hypothetical protein